MSLPVTAAVTPATVALLKELVKVHLNNCSELPNSKYETYKIIRRIRD